MITNNFKTLRKVAHLTSTSSNVGSIYMKNPKFYLTSTTNILMYPEILLSSGAKIHTLPRFGAGYVFSSHNKINSGSNEATKIILGSGTTAPTANDYFLENQITSGLQVNNSSDPSLSINSNGDLLVSILLGITNISSSNIIIAEIGIMHAIRTSMGTYQCKQVSDDALVGDATVLLDRTLLDSPIELPSQGSASIRYNLTFSWPS